MGSDEGDTISKPPHFVTIAPFFMDVTEVTNQQYAEFLSATGQVAPPSWKDGVYPEAEANFPVTGITWYEAAEYAAWKGKRLPTEAEWERAARGNLDRTRYPWGDDVDASRANFLPDPALKRHRGTRPVGCYAANGLQLYDMAGNVWQWVADWYRPDAYRVEERRNPRGPGSGTLRIVRGGSWVTHDVDQLRCAHRHKVPADTYTYSIGFRVVYSDDGSPAGDAV